MKRLMPAGFTLLELMVVVGVIAILAAIALPHFLAAQTRAKVSAAKANLRTITNALEAYAVDNGAYPSTRPTVPGDPLGLLADHQLRPLTTPIAYTAATAFRDPFGTVQVFAPSSAASANIGPNDFPTLTPPNLQKALLYYHYLTYARRTGDPRYAIMGAAVVSIGPDQRDSLGAFGILPADFFASQFPGSGMAPVSTLYDPTNGAVSAGDIPGFAGEANRNPAP